MSNKEIILNKLKELIKTDDDRIKTTDLFLMVEDSLDPKLDLIEFRPFLKETLSDSPYHAVRGKYGGIRLRESLKASLGEEADVSEETIEESDDSKYISIYVTNSLRIHPTDVRNWTIQVKSGNLWFSKAYLPTLSEAMQSCAKKLLDRKLKGGSGTAIKLNELAALVKESEKKVIDKLESLVITNQGNTGKAA